MYIDRLVVISREKADYKTHKKMGTQMHNTIVPNVIQTLTLIQNKFVGAIMYHLHANPVYIHVLINKLIVTYLYINIFGVMYIHSCNYI